jgi:hypothetical protein
MTYQKDAFETEWLLLKELSLCDQTGKNGIGQEMPFWLSHIFSRGLAAVSHGDCRGIHCDEFGELSGDIYSGKDPIKSIRMS